MESVLRGYLYREKKLEVSSCSLNGGSSSERACLMFLSCFFIVLYDRSLNSNVVPNTWQENTAS